mgnify:CR=1 FL=1
MAITIPVITEFSDKGLKSAKAAFANFKTDVSNATGAMGKFKAGSNAALNAVKANAGNFAMAAGAAFVAFAAKGVAAFQDLAISSGKFADATGLSVEEASRFIEVGGDIGIEAGTIESAIGKMNKTLGASPDVFAELGVEIAKTDTGATDVSKTFLNVVERLKGIKDPAQRAAVASQLLGKGWQSMAEMIAMGSDELSKSLSQVSDAKVIDEGELKRARDFRGAMDTMNDAVQDLSLALGEELIPSLIVAAESAVALGDALTFEVAGVSSASGGLGNLGKLWDKIAGNTDEAKDSTERYSGRVKEANEVFLDFTKDVGFQKSEVGELTGAWQTLLGTLDTREAFDNLQESLAKVFDAGIKAFGGTAEEVRDFNSAQKNAIDQIANLAIAMDLTFGQQNQLKIYVDTGDLARAVQYLRDIKSSNAFRFGIGDTSGNFYAGPRAMGGPVSGGGASYLVGERGPEIFTPASSGMITPNSAIGGNTITINVQGADPQAVVRALQDYNRTAGPIPVNTRAN